MTTTLPVGRAVVRGERFRLADVHAAWTARTAAILATHAETGSCTETARRFGVTRQRISQIVRRAARRAA